MTQKGNKDAYRRPESNVGEHTVGVRGNEFKMCQEMVVIKTGTKRDMTDKRTTPRGT